MTDFKTKVEDRKKVILEQVTVKQENGKKIAAEIGRLQNLLNANNSELISLTGAYNELNALVGTPKEVTAKAG